MNPKISEQNLTAVLAIACFIQVAFALWCLYHLAVTGYLPAPFIFDKGDTLMDFYNPLYWSDNWGRYTDWGSVYPPLNFVLLGSIRWIFFGSEQYSSGFEMREAAPLLSICFVACSVLGCFVVTRSRLFSGLNCKQRYLLFVAFALSPPFLFALERGNLVLLALPILAYAIATNGWRRAIAIAVLINLKPYFVLLLLAYWAKGRLEWMMATIVLSGIIFVFSGIAIDPNYLKFLTNAGQFRAVMEATHPGNYLSMASSMDVLRYSIDYWMNVGIDFGGYERDVNAAAMLVRIAIVVTAVGAILCSFICARKLNYNELLLMSVLLILNISLMPGGYSLIFLLPLLPAISQFRFRYAAFVLIAIILLPLDWIPIFTGRNWDVQSHITDQTVTVLEVFGLSAFLRPLATFSLLLLTTLDFLLRPAQVEVHRRNINLSRGLTNDALA